MSGNSRQTFNFQSTDFMFGADQRAPASSSTNASPSTHQSDNMSGQHTFAPANTQGNHTARMNAYPHHQAYPAQIAGMGFTQHHSQFMASMTHQAGHYYGHQAFPGAQPALHTGPASRTYNQFHGGAAPSSIPPAVAYGFQTAASPAPTPRPAATHHFAPPAASTAATPAARVSRDPELQYKITFIMKFFGGRLPTWFDKERSTRSTVDTLFLFCHNEQNQVDEVVRIYGGWPRVPHPVAALIHGLRIIEACQAAEDWRKARTDRFRQRTAQQIQQLRLQQQQTPLAPVQQQPIYQQPVHHQQIYQSIEQPAEQPVHQHSFIQQQPVGPPPIQQRPDEHQNQPSQHGASKETAISIDDFEPAARHQTSLAPETSTSPQLSRERHTRTLSKKQPTLEDEGYTEITELLEQESTSRNPMFAEVLYYRGEQFSKAVGLSNLQRIRWYMNMDDKSGKTFAERHGEHVYYRPWWVKTVGRAPTNTPAKPALVRDEAVPTESTSDVVASREEQDQEIGTQEDVNNILRSMGSLRQPSGPLHVQQEEDFEEEDEENTDEASGPIEFHIMTEEETQTEIHEREERQRLEEKEASPATGPDPEETQMEAQKATPQTSGSPRAAAPPKKSNKGRRKVQRTEEEQKIYEADCRRRKAESARRIRAAKKMALAGEKANERPGKKDTIGDELTSALEAELTATEQARERLNVATASAQNENKDNETMTDAEIEAALEAALMENDDSEETTNAEFAEQVEAARMEDEETTDADLEAQLEAALMEDDEEEKEEEHPNVVESPAQYDTESEESDVDEDDAQIPVPRRPTPPPADVASKKRKAVEYDHAYPEEAPKSPEKRMRLDNATSDEHKPVSNNGSSGNKKRKATEDAREELEGPPRTQEKRIRSDSAIHSYNSGLGKISPGPAPAASPETIEEDTDSLFGDDPVLDSDDDLFGDAALEAEVDVQRIKQQQEAARLEQEAIDQAAAEAEQALISKVGGNDAYELLNSHEIKELREHIENLRGSLETQVNPMIKGRFLRKLNERRDELLQACGEFEQLRVYFQEVYPAP